MVISAEESTLRIFYAVPNTANQGWLPNSSIWRTNLYLPLLDLGCDVVTFDFDYAVFNRNLDPEDPRQREFILHTRPRVSEELLRQVRAAHAQKPIDLFLSYFYAAQVEPEVIRAISAMGITTANWYCNASYQFHLVEEIAPAYDYCLVPEKFRLDDYRRIGAHPIYCQEAANPNIYKPYDLPQEYDVTFVGQKYGTRPMYICALLDAGIGARVWGPLWRQVGAREPLWRQGARRVKAMLLGREIPHRYEVPLERCGPPLSDDELVRMYSRSKISLGFSAVASLPNDGSPAIKQVRLRDFEAPMSGAFYMAEYFEELAEFFEPDQEIVCFMDREELVAKARYYLAHDDARERIRQAGLRRARNEHTWHKRFQMIFREIGLSEHVRNRGHCL